MSGTPRPTGGKARRQSRHPDAMALVDQTATAPVRLSVTVRAGQARAFEVFTVRMGEWWPRSSHSIEGEDVESVHLECRLGGRLVEIHKDGSTASWGTVEVWDPPERVVFSWNPSYEDRPATEVEVVFVALSDDETIVEIEHRHWERHGDRGPALRRGYVEGWLPILELYADYASR
jgi:uncharacterized protein YndB with AHSA1/START domain